MLVCGARHSDLGIFELLHPPRSLLGEEVQEDLCRGSVQILPSEVKPGGAELLLLTLLLLFSDKIILNNALDLGKDGTDIGSALKYYDSINLYMKQLRGALGELRDDIL